MKPPLLPHKDRIRILGSRVDLVSRQSVLDTAKFIFSSNSAHFFVTANALMFLEAKNSPWLQSVIEKATLVITDSSGITWAAKKLALPVPERLPGIDLAFDLCQLSADSSVPVFILGGKPGISDKTVNALKTKIPHLKIGGWHHGYFSTQEEAVLIEKIAKSGAKLVLVALGMPRQEEWIYNHLTTLPPALYIGVGGTLDVWAGELKRAPRWFQTHGFEWLYRLIQEPFRWKRMLQLPLFAFEILSEKKTY